jgi:hypothetical protein
VSLTAGTIFHATKLPLASWFLARWLIASAKKGISSVELGRRLGIKQTNAWSLKQKIMAVMTARENAKRLDGRVEMDDARLPGRPSAGQARPRCRRQAALRGSRLDPRRAPAAQDQAPAGQGLPQEGGQARRQRAPGLDQPPLTDGLGCWTAAAEAGLQHTAMVTGSGRQAAQWSPFKWVNTTLGNIKAAITGTYRRISPEHAGRYLGSFASRYNRRFQLDSLIPRLVHSAVRTAPLPYATLIAC